MPLFRRVKQCTKSLSLELMALVCIDVASMRHARSVELLAIDASPLLIQSRAVLPVNIFWFYVLSQVQRMPVGCVLCGRSSSWQLSTFVDDNY
jgi:hypothetical protein